MIDPNKIFALFSAPDDNNEVVVSDFSSSPLFLIGMYKKIILNSKNINTSLFKNLKHFKNDLNIEDIEDAGVYFMYNKAWEYINQININSTEHNEAIFQSNDKYFLATLEWGLRYFEQLEEYEKCLHIKKIIDLLKSS